MFLLEPLHLQWMGLHGRRKPKPSYVTCKVCFSLFFEEKEGRHASAKAQDAIDHMASFSSCREEISNPRIEPPTSSLGFGYLSTIIR